MTLNIYKFKLKLKLQIHVYISQKSNKAQNTTNAEINLLFFFLVLRDLNKLDEQRGYDTMHKL